MFPHTYTRPNFNLPFPELQLLLRTILRSDPAKRPSILDIINYPWHQVAPAALSPALVTPATARGASGDSYDPVLALLSYTCAGNPPTTSVDVLTDRSATISSQTSWGLLEPERKWEHQCRSHTVFNQRFGSGPLNPTTMPLSLRKVKSLPLALDNTDGITCAKEKPLLLTDLTGAEHPHVAGPPSPVGGGRPKASPVMAGSRALSSIPVNQGARRPAARPVKKAIWRRIVKLFTGCFRANKTCES